MGQKDALSTADFEASIVAGNLTSSEDGASVDATGSRGEGFLVDIETVNTSGDITISFQEKDPGGSWGDIDDSDLDFAGSQTSTNGAQITGISSSTKEAVRYKGDKANLRVKVNSVGSGGDFETVMGVLKTVPRNGLFNT